MLKKKQTNASLSFSVSSNKKEKKNSRTPFDPPIYGDRKQCVEFFVSNKKEKKK